MAIPTLQALEECSDFSKTVKPYLPQLYILPARLFSALLGRETLQELYVNTNPFTSGLAISVLLGAIFLVVSEINRNYSQVDRCWSLLPTLYIAHYDIWAHLTGLPSARIDVALFFSTAWSIRLTFNYWRKGGYAVGSEDYRAIVQKNIGKRAFHLLNWTFVSFIQSVLLFMLSTPVYAVLMATQFEPDLKLADVVFIIVELGLVLLEVIADQQQWDYQVTKKEYQKTAKVPKGTRSQDDLDKGFITSGLWAYSRHPNFAAEQAIWLVLYCWGCYVTNSLYSWHGAGSAFLVLLFQGSTWLTETITADKYLEYGFYQKKVGMFLPKALTPYKKYQEQCAAPKIIKESELARKKRR